MDDKGMKSLPVILTWEAIFDITDITERIELEFGENRAERFESDFQQKMDTLSITFNAHGKVDISYRGYEIRKMVFDPSIIFYVVIEDADGDLKQGIHVLRVLRHERDWQKILSEEQDYSYPEDEDMV